MIRLVRSVGPVTTVVAMLLLVALVAPPPAGAAISSATAVPGADDLLGVACPTEDTCVAVGSTFLPGGIAVGVVVVVRDGVPGPVQQVPGTVTLYGVACTASTSCIAVGQGVGAGAVVAITDGAPARPERVAGTSLLTRIRCSQGQCLAVGRSDSGRSGIVDFGPKRSQLRLVPARVTLADLSCGLRIGCFAVGYESDPALPGGSRGVSIPVEFGRPGSASVVSGTTNIAGISCLARCQAAGSSWDGEEFGGLSVGVGPGAAPRVPVPGTHLLTRVSCVGSRWCVALGDRYGGGTVVPIDRGVPRAWQAVDGASLLNDIACTAAGCLAVGAVTAGWGELDGVVASVPLGS